MIKIIYNFITQNSIKALIFYAILIRFFIFIFYQDVTIYPDSENYIDLATYISHFSLENDPRNRTPGYPLLIALANNSLILTVVYQVILVLLTTVLLFNFSKRRTKSIPTAFWVTFLTSTLIHFLF